MPGAGVVIVDYGMGNLFSLQRVVQHLGEESLISAEPAVVASAARLILPGVGAFGDGMENLRQRGLIEPIKEFSRRGRPLLGICLGMQLLMNASEEFGLHPGLGLVAGSVKKLTAFCLQEASYKIPHVGWNTLNLPPAPAKAWTGTILDAVRAGAFVYFAHSYAVIPESPQDILAETVYGNNRFCAALQKDNLFGCQFHPEISAEVGLRIIRNFLSLCSPTVSDAGQ